MSKLPTADELRELVKDKIITQEEAREILFSEDTKKDRGADSFESEIEFLRKLVEKLSGNNNIVTTIREIETPSWKRCPWYDSYIVWCNNAKTIANYSTATLQGVTPPIVTTTNNFTDIKTF